MRLAYLKAREAYYLTLSYESVVVAANGSSTFWELQVWLYLLTSAAT